MKNLYRDLKSASRLKKRDLEKLLENSSSRLVSVYLSIGLITIPFGELKIIFFGGCAVDRLWFLPVWHFSACSEHQLLRSMLKFSVSPNTTPVAEVLV